MDIHAYGFIEVVAGGKVDWFAEVHVPEDLRLYALLGGGAEVPGVEAVVPARGFPENLSPYAREVMESLVYRLAPSWLSADELDQLLARLEPGSSAQEPLRATLAAMRALDAQAGHAARFVYAFSD